MKWSWQHADIEDSMIGMRGARRHWRQLGTCCVLYAGPPVWVTLRPAEPLPQWPDTWLLMLFNMGYVRDQEVADVLVIDALRKTRRALGDPPSGGMVAFIGDGRDEFRAWSPIELEAMVDAGFNRVAVAEDGAQILRLPADRFPAAWAGKTVTRHARRATGWTR